MENKIVIATKEIEFQVSYDYDDMFEIDWMGNFSNDWSIGAIDISKTGMVNRPGNNDFKYWIPTPGGSEYSDYQKEYINHR